MGEADVRAGWLKFTEIDAIHKSSVGVHDDIQMIVSDKERSYCDANDM